MKPKQKLHTLTLLAASCKIIIYGADELINEGVVKNKLKHHAKGVLAEAEPVINNLYKHLLNEDNRIDEEAELQFFKFTKLIELFVDNYHEKGFDVMNEILSQLKEGQIHVVDEKKHGKILKQMKTV